MKWLLSYTYIGNTSANSYVINQSVINALWCLFAFHWHVEIQLKGQLICRAYRYDFNKCHAIDFCARLNVISVCVALDTHSL